MKKISNIETKKLEYLYRSNKINELEKEAKELLKKESNNTILLNILGVVYLKKKNFSEAETIFKKILNQHNNNENALKNLGETYKNINKYENAIKYYKRYLQKKSNDEVVINKLALCHLKNKNYKDAIKAFKKISKHNPQNQEYLANLGFALIDSLNFKEGMKILESILTKTIDNKRVLSAYLFNQNYNAEIDHAKTKAYINNYLQILNKKKLKLINYNFNKKSKKINLGFVSPDFRSHPVGYAVTNVIKYLKSYNFTLFGYYNSNIYDALTHNFKENFDYFSNIINLNDEEIVNKIRSDGIHMLIDLTGHTTNNRFPIFYYKPAPIQISWCGYLPTSGIKEIKYVIGDPHIHSKIVEKNYHEKILKLPNIWSDFVVTQNINKINLSLKNDDKIIFGCFVTLKKINNNVIKLWSKVLNKFPDTKIFFKSPELKDILIQKNLINKFSLYNIKEDRIILEKSSDYKNYLESYSKIHISLDPFPWNGVTTSFESIWMGVPIFCLEGSTAYSRCSYSINKNLKMDDWIAKDENDYLLKLDKILSNKEELMNIKKNLRQNAIKNNLFNSKKFTKSLADKLIEVWNNYIKK